VVLNYVAMGHNKENADRIVADLGSRAIAIEADVRVPPRVAAMCDQAVRHFGGLDILVNNAGILRDRTVLKMSTEEWQAVIDTNLTGVFNASKAAAERMREGGRIVSLTSISAFAGFFGQANYAAAKAGVTAFTRVLARELAKRQITVNAVAPGVILTEMGQSIPEAVRAAMLPNIPLGRFGQSGDVADAILFLCSDMAAYVTGQVLHVNGGWWW
jgi:3-oxoacyl-[acyl-carrier protein] reductase